MAVITKPEEVKRKIEKSKTDAAISKSIKEDKGITPKEELAIHRKTIALILQHLGLNVPEFDKYNKIVEECKKKIKGGK